MLVVMIEAPHSLHSHANLSSCIYTVFQHLLLQLQVMRMQTVIDIERGQIGSTRRESLGFSLG